MFFSNGTLVDVPRIESNNQYKDIMRQIADPESTIPRLLKPKTLPSALDWFVDRWQPRSPESAALGDMLIALKSAAESYISSPVTKADFTTPLRSFSSRGRNLLDKAMQTAGLRKGTFATAYAEAGEMATIANGIGEGCIDQTKWEDIGPGLILTVDYSRSALTANLYLFEDCIFDSLRVLNVFNMGSTYLDECQRSRPIDDCLNPVKDALHELLRRPIEQPEYWDAAHVPTKVESVVLLGDKGTDPRLRRGLKEVLAKMNVVLRLHEFSEDLRPGNLLDVTDPAFAAARGIARVSWDRQSDPFKDEL